MEWPEGCKQMEYALPTRVPGSIDTLRLRLELAIFCSVDDEIYLAIKNQDYPLKDLLRLPGFEPAVRVE